MDDVAPALVTTPESEPTDNASGEASSAIIDELLTGLQSAAKSIVPRFLATMPSHYFCDTDQSTRLSHIKAIIAAEASGVSQAITLVNEERTRYTVISDHSYPGQLGELVTRLPTELPLCSARVYTATDGSRVLDVFKFGEVAAYDRHDPDQRAKAEAVLEYARHQERELPLPRLAHHLEHCARQYLRAVPVAVICQQFRLAERVRATGNTVIALSNRADYNLSSVAVGVNSAERRRLFESISRYFGQNGIDIQRAYLDGFEANGGEPVSLLRFLVNESGGGMLDPRGTLWSRVGADLQRLVYVDDAVPRLAEELPNRDLLRAEVLIALSHLAHQVLVKRDVLAFTRKRIIRVALRYWPLADLMVEGFLERFRPESTASPLTQDGPLSERIRKEVDKQDEQLIMSTLLSAVGSVVRSNVHAPDRYALCLRIDPQFLMSPDRTERPFGVFFVHGRGFDGFHVRFRDIARGGVRLVRPTGREQYTLESERLYDEAYGLAYAQQLKNKDIPEGGSKGVVLAQPSADLERVGRAFADALLDLVIPASKARCCNADHYGRDEQLYLGPDENVSNGLINWIIERARRRGHPMPNVFMSSKPGAGINHKAYGVTSEGVTVFLEAALRARGIDPRRQPFTVKLTGGPDGDVAGNEIRILQREYGAHARIVGIADGSGCLEDPDGLDHGELLRLVNTEQPVSGFAASRLGPRGRLLRLDQRGGLQARNTLHNRLVTDAFIPAGGRPQTINDENWSDFLRPDGEPSSPVIVEGANLFITPDARQRLSECGVLIVKDSSANKCGVICSSYEIIAGMLLKESEFLQLKERFVDEVLVKLRALARLEADTLFREQRHKPNVPLPELSTRLSRIINRATDAVTEVLAVLPVEDRPLTLGLVRRYLPAILLEHRGETVFERIPSAYLTQVMASSLASRIVYREGLDWLEHMPDSAVADLALRYLRQESELQSLVEAVEDSQLAGKERIAELLREGGVAAALRQG